MNYDIEKLRQLQDPAKGYTQMEASKASKKCVYTFAEEVAKKIDFKPGANIQELVEANDGKIHYLDFSQLNNADGSIYVHNDRSFDIVLPKYTGPLRDRFTIAHELGHYLMHKPHEKSWAARKGSDRLEWEANWFAAGFLMPEELFRAKMREGADISDLAAHFGVSMAAAEIRYGTLKEK